LNQILPAFVFVVLAATCARAENESGIPITTSSERAREYYQQGLEMEDRLRAREARFFYEKAVAEDSTFALAYMNLAYAQPTAWGFLEKLNRAVALADSVSEGERLIILAAKAAYEGDPLRQRDYYQKLRELHPEDARVYNLLGTVCYGLQDYAEAIEYFQKAIAVRPDFSAPYNMLGYCYRALTKYEEAEQAFKKYVELIPDDPNPYDSYAELLMKMGKYALSIEYYQKALKIDPMFGASHVGIASNLNFMGRYAEAREQLQKYYHNAQDLVQQREALAGLALSYLDEGKTDSAWAYINQRIELARKNNDLLAVSRDQAAIGRVFLKNGDYNQAFSQFADALELIENSDLSAEVKDNSRRSFLVHEILVLAAKQDFAAATARADDYYRRIEAGGNPTFLRQAHELRGIIALAQEKYDAAVTELLQASLENPYNLYRLAQAYAGAGDKVKARESCRKAAECNVSNDFYLSLIRKDAEQLLAELSTGS